MGKDAPAPATPAPLKYVGGDPSLDLVNTVDWTVRGAVNDRLDSYERLTEWAEGAGVVSRAEARRLRHAARDRPDDAASALDTAVALRALLRRIFLSIATGTADEPAWQELDRRLTDALRRLRVRPVPADGARPQAARWEWHDADAHLESLLWPVLRSAADLLTSDEMALFKVCDGPDCGWMYVDRSRNRLRRWCEMETCGTDAKSRRRRERRERRRSG